MTKAKHTILAVDDEKDMLKTFQNVLKKKYNLLTSESGSKALKIIQEENVDLILLDIRLPKMDGIEILKKAKAALPDLEIIMVSASKDVASAVEAMKLGAFDYITKPFDVAELIVVIEKALEKRSLIKENLYLKEALAQASSYCDLLGKTAEMKKIFETIDTVAKGDSRVLITGESGTGKELVARAVHNKSKRANKPFVAINCAALPENLLESELFGYERGAFTNALERKLGKFELADGGTIFLDEIGCMPASMQAKLLRVVQEKTIDRVGGTAPINIDVRILSASNIDFPSAIKEKTFREDLYYRLNVIPIHLPPLRERREDIPLFLSYFLNQYNKELNKNITGFEKEAVTLLKSYDWPGNVRELQNIIERLVTLSSQNMLTQNDIERTLNIPVAAHPPATGSQGLNQTLESFERNHIKQVLEETNGNRTQAAKKLGIARTTLVTKLETLGIK
ncbi:MAG: sigma-54 dependent transcriptional regulator [Candidatus Margulisbacteria bacterium]|nr:sigma-54 dependent transcriptional regulator [Candidatus Margulisiibacteriota bacterium]